MAKTRHNFHKGCTKKTDAKGVEHVLVILNTSKTNETTFKYVEKHPDGTQKTFSSSYSKHNGISAEHYAETAPDGAPTYFKGWSEEGFCKRTYKSIEKPVLPKYIDCMVDASGICGEITTTLHGKSITYEGQVMLTDGGAIADGFGVKIESTTPPNSRFITQPQHADKIQLAGYYEEGAYVSYPWQ